MVSPAVRRALNATPRDDAAAQVAQLGTILGVWAHPDDEAYHSDGLCSRIKPTVGADQVGAIIDRVQPDTILTFDPGEMTGHPDHRASPSGPHKPTGPDPASTTWKPSLPARGRSISA